MNHWPAYIEVDLNQVRHNVKEIRRRIGPEVTLMLVVKVDAYGHGAPAVARAVLEAGAAAGCGLCGRGRRPAGGWDHLPHPDRGAGLSQG